MCKGDREKIVTYGQWVTLWRFYTIGVDNIVYVDLSFVCFKYSMKIANDSFWV